MRTGVCQAVSLGGLARLHFQVNSSRCACGCVCVCERMCALVTSSYSTVTFQPLRGKWPGFNVHFSAFVGKYESHTRVHTGEKPFECDVCHQRYSTKSNLTVHRKKHSADTEVPKKEHRCPRCDKLHASKKTLAKHVKRQVSPRSRDVPRCAFRRKRVAGQKPPRRGHAPPALSSRSILQSLIH